MISKLRAFLASSLVFASTLVFASPVNSSPISRIAVASPSATDDILNLNLGHTLVSACSQCYLNTGMSKLPDTGDSNDLDISALAASKPHVIVGSSENAKQLGALKSLGVPVIILEATTPEEILVEFYALAKTLGVPKTAEVKIKKILTDLQKQYTPKPAVLMLSVNPLIVGTSSLLFSHVLLQYGLVNIVESPEAFLQGDLGGFLEAKIPVILVPNSAEDLQLLSSSFAKSQNGIVGYDLVYLTLNSISLFTVSQAIREHLDTHREYI